MEGRLVIIFLGRERAVEEKEMWMREYWTGRQGAEVAQVILLDKKGIV